MAGHVGSAGSMLLEDLHQGEAGRHIINSACWVWLLFQGGLKQANCPLISVRSFLSMKHVIGEMDFALCTQAVYIGQKLPLPQGNRYYAALST